MKSDAKVFTKRSIDRVGGFDRARQVNRDCGLQAKEHGRNESDVVFTFERKNHGGKGRALTGDLRISTAIQANKKTGKHSIDLTMRFSAEICKKLGLKVGDRVRAQASANGIWHIDLTRPSRGYALVASHSNSGTMYVRFATDYASVAAIGLARIGDDIPGIDCELVEADDCTAVFCSRD